MTFEGALQQALGDGLAKGEPEAIALAAEGLVDDALAEGEGPAGGRT